MSDDNFLSRWSRRKREVARAEHHEVQSPAEPVRAADPAPPDAPPSDAPADPAPADPSESEVDLSSLPSLESITGSTDITGFLRRGVPDELARSALRKAWVSDPAIRDFIGIAENQWDFNDPASIPGFGAIDFSPDEVRQMAAKLVGEVQEAAEKVEDTLQSAALKTAAPQENVQDQASAADINSPKPAAPPHDVAENVNVAPQQKEEDSPAESSKPRRHGGALPR
jgi:hypothetical protein